MDYLSQNTLLLATPVSNQDAKLRLVCFAYAGGGSATFLPWPKLLPNNVELVVCQLPGRGARLLEEPYEQLGALIQDLCNAIKPLCDLPLVFFGHSMGSKLAYELSLSMQRNNLPLPVHLIASAAAAPFHARRKPPIHNLPEPEFIAAVAELKGTPKQVLDNAEIMALLIPALRADFKLVETYLNPSRTVLDTRLTLMGGVMDDTVSPSELADWNKLFTQTSPLRWFEGDHFFINQKTFSVLKHINAILDMEIARAHDAPCAPSLDLYRA